MSCPDALCLDVITEPESDHPNAPKQAFVCLLAPHGDDVPHSDGTRAWEHTALGWCSWLDSSPVA